MLRDFAAEAAGAAYVTIDRWRERKDWEAFMNQYGGAYRALDSACVAVTLEEAEIGAFVTA